MNYIILMFKRKKSNKFLSDIYETYCQYTFIFFFYFFYVIVIYKNNKYMLKRGSRVEPGHFTSGVDIRGLRDGDGWNAPSYPMSS